MQRNHIKRGILLAGLAIALVVTSFGSFFDGHAVEAKNRDRGASTRGDLTAKAIQTFTESSPIAITNGLTTSSTITVGGLLAPLVDVSVTLNNLSTTVSSDLDVLLVGPSGQMALIVSDMGGNNTAADVTLTLDDQAANQLSSIQPLTSGRFQPANFDTGDTFDSPPSPVNTPPLGVRLGIFTGTDPNGTWSLFVRDDTNNGSISAIAGGWSLRITAADEPPPPTPTNGVPEGAPDSFQAQAGKPLTVAGPGVLGNDRDPDGDVLTAILAGQPKQGSVLLRADGSFTYTAKKTAKGADSFTYLAQDPDGRNSLTTVDIQLKKAKKKNKGKSGKK